MFVQQVIFMLYADDTAIKFWLITISIKRKKHAEMCASGPKAIPRAIN